MTKEGCEALRREVEVVANKVWEELRGESLSVPGEAIASMTLAYRHLEDALKRIEKAIKALASPC